MRKPFLFLSPLALLACELTVNPDPASTTPGVQERPEVAESQAQSYVFPDERGVQLASADWQTLETMRRDGDNRGVKRNVDHLLKPLSASSDSQALLVMELSRVFPKATITALENGNVKVVFLSGMSAQDLATQQRILTNRGQKYGYGYNGWGAPVVTA